MKKRAPQRAYKKDIGVARLPFLQLLHPSF